MTSEPLDGVQDKPPVARNQALVSGAIKWSRSLFARCKRTYVVLNAVEPGLLHEPAGKQAWHIKAKTLHESVPHPVNNQLCLRCHMGNLQQLVTDGV